MAEQAHCEHPWTEHRRAGDPHPTDSYYTTRQPGCYHKLDNGAYCLCTAAPPDQRVVELEQQVTTLLSDIQRLRAEVSRVHPELRFDGDDLKYGPFTVARLRERPSIAIDSIGQKGWFYQNRLGAVEFIGKPSQTREEAADAAMAWAKDVTVFAKIEKALPVLAVDTGRVAAEQPRYAECEGSQHRPPPGIKTAHIIVMGEYAVVEVWNTDTLADIRTAALHVTRNTGRPENEFEIRSEDGMKLDPSANAEQTLGRTRRIFLSMCVGVGGAAWYRHYKGGEYEFIGIANHHESRASWVVYRSLKHGTLNVRLFDGTENDPDGWDDIMSTGERRFTRMETPLAPAETLLKQRVANLTDDVQQWRAEAKRLEGELLVSNSAINSAVLVLGEVTKLGPNKLLRDLAEAAAFEIRSLHRVMRVTYFPAKGPCTYEWTDAQIADIKPGALVDWHPVGDARISTVTVRYFPADTSVPGAPRIRTGANSSVLLSECDPATLRAPTYVWDTEQIARIKPRMLVDWRRPDGEGVETITVEDFPTGSVAAWRIRTSLRGNTMSVPLEQCDPATLRAPVGYPQNMSDDLQDVLVHVLRGVANRLPESGAEKLVRTALLVQAQALSLRVPW